MLALLVLALSGCATVPVVHRELTPPEAVAPVKPHADHPLIALALGGGAARGFAHVGVIQALEAHGISPDVVVGTSAGSFVGALYAGGYDGQALETIALGLNEDDLRDVVLPDRGFVKGERLQDFINRYLGNRNIEQLPKPFAAVATNLETGALTAFSRGNTGMAVRASSSIPGIFQPARINGADYVDGGLVSPVPVRVAREFGADIVIAVDVSRKPEDNASLKSTAGVLAQTLAIMGNAVSACEVDRADVIIRPDVSEIGTLDFAHKRAAIAEGRRAADAAIPRILALIRDKLDGKASAPRTSRAAGAG